jgi:hypothetical protein
MMVVFFGTLFSYRQSQTRPNYNPSKRIVSFNRLSGKHRQLLTSSVAHVRNGYVANRTPDIDTPPLLILPNTSKQSLQHQLIHITNAYFFSMLIDGSAFAYDTTWPVRFEWYFEPTPGYMAMNSHQAQFYLDRTSAESVHSQSPSAAELSSRSFRDNYKARNIQIVRTEKDWGTEPVWSELKKNPSMGGAGGKYRLNHLEQKSDWFWVASRLLFSRPSGWFQTQLEPYKELLGGKLQLGEGLSYFDPENSLSPEILTRWFRIGVRFVGNSEDASCMASHIADKCQQDRACHVFISAPDRERFQLIRSAMTKYLGPYRISVHAVAEGYAFASFDQSMKVDDDYNPFDSDENRLKMNYARSFMDWLILSRMDYLVGQENDLFITTAAWAAQVQTDLKRSGSWHLEAMEDW